MRLSTIRWHDGSTSAAVEQDDTLVLLSAPNVGDLISRTGWRERAGEALRDTSAERVAKSTADYAAALRPGKVICCGLNYRDHIAETGRETPEYPTLFAKFADALTGPSDTIVVTGSNRVDWEAELALVVGIRAHRISPAEARTAILGYTVANDVSMRDWQARTLQWFQGKAWDASTPLGPAIVTGDEFDPARGATIECAINDEVVQSSTTDQLLFDAPFLLSYVSQFTTLQPGDLILTGTPSGVGLGREPQRWLRDGDVLTTRIAGIGELRNTVRITASGTPGRTPFRDAGEGDTP